MPVSPLPLLVSFTDISHVEAAFLLAPRGSSREVLEQEVEQLRSLFERGLPPVSSARSIALLFGLNPSFVLYLMKRRTRLYRPFSINMKGKTRRIFAPRVALKVVQRWFGHHLAASSTMPSHVHGFVPGRSIVTGAEPHCGKDWLISFDIEDFFPSVTEEMVQAALERCGYSALAATTLTALTMLPTGGLPQGAPSSPVLSNLCFRDADQRLTEYAEERQWTLTRYADDITLSGTGAPPDLQRVESEMNTLLQGCGFVLNERKTKLMTRAGGMVVLGLSVHGMRPKLGKAMRDRVRAAEYTLSTHGASMTDEQMRRLYGLKAFSAMLSKANVSGVCTPLG